MPIHRCQRKGESGWQYGNQKCYIPSEEGSDAAAYRKALAQGQAVKASGYREGVQTVQSVNSQLLQHVRSHDE